MPGCCRLTGLFKAMAEARERFAVQRFRWRHRYLHRYEFIHINKCAGSSIKHALDVPWEEKHKTAHEKIAELGRKTWKKKFTFAVVRNPWDRLVSQYHYRLDSGQNTLDVNPIPFREWILKTFRDKDPVYYDDPQMFMPQLDWIAAQDGTLLVDVVCRYENLEEDFRKVCEKIGVEASLPHLKKSSRADYPSYYDDETRAVVTAWFKKDIEAFGYTYEQASGRSATNGNP